MTDLSSSKAVARQAAGEPRQRRRVLQEAHAVQAIQDSLLVPPQGAEKEAQLQARAEAKAAQPAGASIRKSVQAANAARADVEKVLYAAPAPRGLDALKPGSTPSLLQLRQLSKFNASVAKDEATAAGVAAGRAVRDTLLGRTERTSPHSRQRKIDEAQRRLQLAGANGTQNQTGR